MQDELVMLLGEYDGRCGRPKHGYSKEYCDVKSASP
jgi:hypothetical protein